MKTLIYVSKCNDSILSHYLHFWSYMLVMFMLCVNCAINVVHNKVGLLNIDNEQPSTKLGKVFRTSLIIFKYRSVFRIVEILTKCRRSVWGFQILASCHKFISKVGFIVYVCIYIYQLYIKEEDRQENVYCVFYIIDISVIYKEGCINVIYAQLTNNWMQHFSSQTLSQHVNYLIF